MAHFSSFQKQTAWLLSCLALLLMTSNSSLAQAPPVLGTSASYGAFSGDGAIGNTGLTMITGDVGTYIGAVTGFPPGIYTGALHVADQPALVAANDLTLAYNSLNDATHSVMFDTALGSTMGNGQILTPRTYGRGDLTTISGDLTFDAKGNSGAIFIIKIRAALDVSKNTQILLINGAQASNIYWAVDGAVSILDFSNFKGTILANGAIHLYGGTLLEGRALAVVGAVTMASNMVNVPGGGAADDTLVVFTPLDGDSVDAGMENYRITWGGSGIAPTKTLEYSLDGGSVWTTIGMMTSDVTFYDWNVPDTVSEKALVRVTDQNGLRGTSGMFSIVPEKVPGTLIVVRPASGELIDGGTENYQIRWIGTDLAPEKTFELSLDSGATWTTIGMTTSDAMEYAWNVPDTASTKAQIRITDGNGVSGTSGIFTIVSSTLPGSIIVVRPSSGEVIEGGSTLYQIRFTAVNTTSQKSFEYSLDGGTTWNWIGLMNSDDSEYTWENLPNVATNQGLIRITDANGVTGISEMFTITLTPGAGSINSVTLSGLDNNGNIANNRTLGITWEFTPDIGTSVLVEYSLDGQTTWVPITTVLTTDSPNTTWMTPIAGSYNPVFIRVTSSDGMSRTSAPFSIRSVSSVSTEASTNGFSLSNYPNPASQQTTISFVIPVPGQVSLTIVDGLGRQTGIAASQQFHAGSHDVRIDTSKLPAGSYSYILQAGATRLVGRMNIVR